MQHPYVSQGPKEKPSVCRREMVAIVNYIHGIWQFSELPDGHEVKRSNNSSVQKSRGDMDIKNA